MKRYILILLLFIGILFTGNSVLAFNPADQKSAGLIPASLVSDCVPGSVVNNDGSTNDGNLGNCIRGLYTFTVGAVAVLAAGVIMWGGFVWLTSGGNVSRVESAKEYIYGAVFGLVLALTSFLLLNTINPQLTTLTIAIPVPPNNPNEVDTVFCNVFRKDSDGEIILSTKIGINVSIALAGDDCSRLDTPKQGAIKADDIHAENFCAPSRTACVNRSAPRNQRGTIVNGTECNPRCTSGETCCNPKINR